MSRMKEAYINGMIEIHPNELTRMIQQEVAIESFPNPDLEYQEIITLQRLESDTQKRIVSFAEAKFLHKLDKSIEKIQEINKELAESRKNLYRIVEPINKEQKQ